MYSFLGRVDIHNSVDPHTQAGILLTGTTTGKAVGLSDAVSLFCHCGEHEMLNMSKLGAPSTSGMCAFGAHQVKHGIGPAAPAGAQVISHGRQPVVKGYDWSASPSGTTEAPISLNSIRRPSRACLLGAPAHHGLAPVAGNLRPSGTNRSLNTYAGMGTNCRSPFFALRNTYCTECG